MFSTPEQLLKKTRQKDLGRKEFLQQLVLEFEKTSSLEVKHQIFANLANFAYDPINYEFLRELKVIDLFLDNLSGNDIKLIKFAIGGLCNLVLDSENKDYVLHCNGINTIKEFLSYSEEDIVLSAITSLMFLVTPQSKKDITSDDIISHMLQFKENSNPRLQNLAVVFLEDYCTAEQVNRCKQLLPPVQNIPLPTIDAIPLPQ